jgi:hypothetical protein
MLESIRRFFGQDSDVRVHQITPPPDTDGLDPFVLDSPVTDVQSDRFNRQPFAQRVAKTLAEETRPEQYCRFVT